MLVRAARGSRSHRVIASWQASARRLVAALVVASLPSLGCASQGSSGTLSPPIAVTWTLNPRAPTVGRATLTVSVRNQAGAPVSNAVVRVQGLMSHAGMAPVLATGTERAPGDYEVPLEFTMAGDWVLIVKTSVGREGGIEFRIDVANVRP